MCGVKTFRPRLFVARTMFKFDRSSSRPRKIFLLQSNIPRAGAQLKAPELLVLAAEVAVKNGEFDTAREACHEFFLDSWGTKDQFYCRALFVKVLFVWNIQHMG